MVDLKISNKPENTRTNDPTVLQKNPKLVWQVDHEYSLQSRHVYQPNNSINYKEHINVLQISAV